MEEIYANDDSKNVLIVDMDANRILESELVKALNANAGRILEVFNSILQREPPSEVSFYQLKKLEQVSKMNNVPISLEITIIDIVKNSRIFTKSDIYLMLATFLFGAIMFIPMYLLLIGEKTIAIDISLMPFLLIAMMVVLSNPLFMLLVLGGASKKNEESTTAPPTEDQRSEVIVALPTIIGICIFIKLIGKIINHWDTNKCMKEDIISNFEENQL